MNIGELVVKMTANTAGLEQGVTKAQNKLGGLGKIIGGISFAALTAGAVTLAKKATDVGIAFEQSMANVVSVLGGSQEEFNQLSGIARQWGETTTFSAKQVADAMYYLASAGWNAQQTTEALNGTLMLAGATQADLAFTTETVVGVVNQFGLQAKDADRIANVFAATICKSQAEIDKLSTSFSYVGPIASQFGLSVEQTSAMLGILYNKGIDASMAGTSLRMAMVQLLNPTSSAQEILAKYNITTTDSTGKMLAFDQIVKQFTNTQLTAAEAVEVFGVRSGPLMLQLIQGYDEYENLTKAITGTTVAQDMYNTQTNTTQGTIKLLQNKISELSLKFFDLAGPVLNKVLDALITFVDWLNGPGGKAIVNFGKVVGDVFQAIGTVIAGIIFVFEKLINFIVNVFSLNWQEAWQNIKDIFYGVLEPMISWITNLGKKLVEGLWNGIKSMFGWIKDKIEGFGKSIIDWFKGIFGISSPSRVMANIGAQLVQGLNKGMQEEYQKTLPEMQESYKKYMQEIVTAGVRKSPLEESIEAYKKYATEAGISKETQYQYLNYLTGGKYTEEPEKIFQYAPVTFEEHKLGMISDIGKSLEQQLQQAYASLGGGPQYKAYAQLMQSQYEQMKFQYSMMQEPSGLGPYVYGAHGYPNPYAINNQTSQNPFQDQQLAAMKTVNVNIGSYSSQLSPEQLAYTIGKEVNNDYNIKVNPV